MSLNEQEERRCEQATVRPSSHRVLIVDDNPDSAESMATLMELWHHEVRIAYDGPSAIEIAREFRPELVLLDIGLPGMNGHEVARHLREDLLLSKAVLVALTGFGMEEDRRRSREAGFDHHLVKPVELEALQAVLTTVA